jgi:GNAT superfamily N-acetyltransferase
MRTRRFDGSVSVLGRLHTLGPSLILAKLRRRLWSTRRAIAVVRQIEQPLFPGHAGMRVMLVDAGTFVVLPRLVETAVGAEYLYVRPIERTRQAAAGRLAVATDTAGDVMAFHFVHDRADADRLERVAPKMYPQMAPDEVLTEAVYCLPAYRGQDVTSNLLRTTGSLLAAEGIRRAWAYIDSTNAASLRLFRRAGYSPSGTERVDRYRFFRFTTVFRDLTPTTSAEWASATTAVKTDHH